MAMDRSVPSKNQRGIGGESDGGSRCDLDTFASNPKSFEILYGSVRSQDGDDAQGGGKSSADAESVPLWSVMLSEGRANESRPESKHLAVRSGGLHTNPHSSRTTLRSSGGVRTYLMCCEHE